MKKILMFHFNGCPHCAKAHAYIEELMSEYTCYRSLEIEKVDERLHPEIADQYDYYYVPTFYVDGKKVFEGSPKKEDIQKVFNEAIQE